MVITVYGEELLENSYSPLSVNVEFYCWPVSGGQEEEIIC